MTTKSQSSRQVSNELQEGFEEYEEIVSHGTVSTPKICPNQQQEADIPISSLYMHPDRSRQFSNPISRELPITKPHVQLTQPTHHSIEQHKPIQQVISLDDEFESVQSTPRLTNVHFSPKKGYFARKPRSIILHPDIHNPLSSIICTSTLDGAIQFTSLSRTGKYV
jgi:hypothetical protein